MDNHDASILHDTAVYRAELVRLLTQRFDAPGTYETAIAPLHVIRGAPAGAVPDRAGAQGSRAG